MSAIKIEKIGDIFAATDFYTGAKVKRMTQEEMGLLFEFASAEDAKDKKARNRKIEKQGDSANRI